uniref:RING-type domain-containing protein n=1 Tax=Alexandrium monilatum TaxID=311494 RepID=A0A7S4VSS0_9DINO|mmetsp:Transcript_76801/g.237208  ORF Transcript_76801/g.237208 Transcript_76801/m.237208 type:complete len:280 (+) Transcript_76801:60-899(+)
MDQEESWEPLDLGWGDEDGQALLRCRARIVVPPSVCTTICCPWSLLQAERDWWPAQAWLQVRSESASETLLKVRRIDGRGAKEIKLPLSLVSGLHRLRVDGDEAPGMELRIARTRPRLQILALPLTGYTGGDEKAVTAWARLQLLHAFLAATAEAYNQALAEEASAGPVRQLVTRVWPLEWPHEDGRRASLAFLAKVLRGVTAMTAKEVMSHARFAGNHCPVCLESWEDMNPDRPAVALACGHGFCEQCLQPAVQHLQASCPTCRWAFGAPTDPASTGR